MKQAFTIFLAVCAVLALPTCNKPGTVTGYDVDPWDSILNAPMPFDQCASEMRDSSVWLIERIRTLELIHTSNARKPTYIQADPGIYQWKKKQ
jgi:hypothetical protein